MATTGDAGRATPTISVSGNPNAYTLTVISTHDGYEWVTGDLSVSVASD